MSGLVDAKTGLRFGNGLYFEPGLGGAGLTNQDEQFDAITFAGTGSLAVSARIIAAARGTFGGAGSMSVTTS